ncbi:hypothetical protein JTB14_004292 [Gonioctena quinquepunctata]|nr:hypothetical protein JTB14_004292 [Gonioctena quinquepunctata]
MLMLTLNKQTKERFKTIEDKEPNISTSNNDPDYIPSDDNDSEHGSCHNQEVSDEEILTLPESSVGVSSTMNESNSNENQYATITAVIAVSSDNFINNNISITNENELTKKETIQKRKRYALSEKERKKQKSAALAQLHGVLKESCTENCGKWNVHIDKATKAREKYREDVEKTEDVGKVINCADLEKVIIFPILETFKNAVFTNRITVYNESFVPNAPKGDSNLRSTVVVVVVPAVAAWVVFLEEAMRLIELLEAVEEKHAH